GLDRAGKQRPTNKCGRQLAQELVLGAATDHVDDLDLETRDPLQALEDEAILASEGHQRAANDLPWCLGRRLTAGAARIADPTRHVSRGYELLVVGIEDGHLRRSGGRELNQLTVRGGVTLAVPLLTAFL